MFLHALLRYTVAMKKTFLILACFFLCLSETRADDPYIYSGNPENPSFLKFDDSNKKSEYKSTLLTYFCDYSNALMHAPGVCDSFLHEDLKGKSTDEMKKIIMERIVNHPEEVNDVALGCESNGTPLCFATDIGDYDLVALLLENGAIPWSPNGIEYSDGDFEYSGEDQKRIRQLIEEAQKKWPQVAKPRFFNTLRSTYYQTNRKK